VELASFITREAGLGRDTTSMPTAERDPLSARWDGAAGRFVTRVIAADGRWAETVVAPLGPRVTAWALGQGIDPGMIFYAGRGSGIETASERAFRRAVYYDLRVYLWARPYAMGPDGQVRNPERVVALKFRWGPRTARGRVARAQAWPIASASRYASRNRPWHD
jgi:hypothetical protein